MLDVLLSDIAYRNMQERRYPWSGMSKAGTPPTGTPLRSNDAEARIEAKEGEPAGHGKAGRS